MQDKQNEGRGGSGPSSQERVTNGKEPLHPDQELVYRVKSAIDGRGRYSFRLNDMSAGLASGKSITHASARRTIEEQFKEQLGLSPQEYLDRHYEDRREQGLENRPARERQGRERGR